MGRLDCLKNVIAEHVVREWSSYAINFRFCFEKGSETQTRMNRNYYIKRKAIAGRQPKKSFLRFHRTWTVSYRKYGVASAHGFRTLLFFLCSDQKTYEMHKIMAQFLHKTVTSHIKEWNLVMSAQNNCLFFRYLFSNNLTSLPPSIFKGLHHLQIL